MAETDILSPFAGTGGDIVSQLIWIIPLILIIGVGVIIYLAIKDKKIFKFPVTIFSERENGGIRERETKGGFLTRKGGIAYFAIKVGKFKKKEFITPPILSGITENDRIYYAQKDVDTYIQLRREIDKEIVNFIPVENDIKYGAVLSIQKINQVLKQENKWEKFLAPGLIIIGLAIILIMFLVMMDKFKPEIMMQVSENMAHTMELMAKLEASKGIIT